MKTYIINLERSVRRRTMIVGEMKKHGLDHEIVPALDGSTLTSEQLAELPIADSVRRDFTYYTPNVIAAAFSHTRVYELILKNELDMALVLEDDATLCEGFADVLASIERTIRENEIVVCHFMSFQTMELFRAGAEVLSGGYMLHHAASLNDVNSGAGYVITRGAAEMMLRTAIPIQTQADSWEKFHALGGAESIRFVYPTPVRVRGDKSTIAIDYQSNVRKWLTSAFDDYRVPPFHQILRAARLRSIARRSRVVLVDGENEAAGRGSL